MGTFRRLVCKHRRNITQSDCRFNLRFALDTPPLHSTERAKERGLGWGGRWDGQGAVARRGVIVFFLAAALFPPGLEKEEGSPVGGLAFSL